MLKIRAFSLLWQASISQISFFSMPLGLALMFPSLAYDSIPVGVRGFLWMGRAGCLKGGEGSPWWLLPREQWHCCCERGREDAACLRSEGGCQSWEAEGQVLLWCGDPVCNPFPPWWVLISSREDFLQHYYFLCISVCTASIPFRSLARYLENCK